MGWRTSTGFKVRRNLSSRPGCVACQLHVCRGSGHMPTLNVPVGPVAVRSSGLVVWKEPAAVLGSSQALSCDSLPHVTGLTSSSCSPFLHYYYSLLSAATVIGRTNGIHLC